MRLGGFDINNKEIVSTPRTKSMAVISVGDLWRRLQEATKFPDVLFPLTALRFFLDVFIFSKGKTESLGEALRKEAACSKLLCWLQGLACSTWHKGGAQ